MSHDSSDYIIVLRGVREEGLTSQPARPEPMEPTEEDQDPPEVVESVNELQEKRREHRLECTLQHRDWHQENSINPCSLSGFGKALGL